MKITRIRVDGFGVWHDRSWDDLADGVNVFHGPNEAGKTTLMSFVRAVLFGFERRNHSRRYEPLDGGNHGGVLEVVHQGQAVGIERKQGRHVRGQVRIHRDSGEAGNESDLEKMLAGTTRTLYHNVFAFGLEELEQFRTLEESEVASHILGAGMGVGASRWAGVWKDLEDRRRSLFLPKGKTSTINRALEDLQAVREELDRTEAEPREYLEAHERRSELDVELREQEVRVEKLRRRVAHYERLRQAEPHRKRRAELEATLQEMESVERFPEGGVERLNMLVHQRRQLQAEAGADEAEDQRLRAERARLAAEYTPQELLRRERVVEGLRTHLPRLQALEERGSGALEVRDRIQAEHAAATARREADAPPSPVPAVAFASLVAVVAVTLFLAENGIAGGAVSFTLLLIAYWYNQRRKRAAGIEEELGEIASRLRAASDDLTRVQRNRAEVQHVLKTLTGKDGVSQSDIETQATRVRVLTGMADRIRSIDELLTRKEQRREVLGGRIAETEGAIGKLLAEADAPTENEFLRRSEVYGRRRKILDELERTPFGKVSAEDEELAAIDHVDEETFRQTRESLASAVENLESSRIEAGRLEERISTLSRSEERSRARGKQEAIVARVDEASEQWAILTLCRSLLDETRRVYETDRQPEVLQHASGFFHRMSGGRWVRVISPLGASDLVLESASGDRVSPENLSRGTAEQLYLAMRLALVREYSRHIEPLPVIFDDIFVNFDMERTRRAIESVRDLSETHQVLLFTCHPHLVELVRDVVPEASVYSL